MTVKQIVIAAIVRQFGHPQGVPGQVAGWVIAYRPSNRQRNGWVVSLLGVRPTDRVLEIGFGPGLAIAELSRRVGPSGHVYGVDHSYLMLRQATRCNAAAIQAGRVTLSQGTVEALPPALDGPFDAIVAVNSLGFWPAPVGDSTSSADDSDPVDASPSPPNPAVQGPRRARPIMPPARSKRCSNRPATPR